MTDKDFKEVRLEPAFERKEFWETMYDRRVFTKCMLPRFMNGLSQFAIITPLEFSKGSTEPT